MSEQDPNNEQNQDPKDQNQEKKAENQEQTPENVPNPTEKPLEEGATKEEKNEEGNIEEQKEEKNAEEKKDGEGEGEGEEKEINPETLNDPENAAEDAENEDNATESENQNKSKVQEKEQTLIDMEAVEREKKKISQSKVEMIQQQIQDVTKKLEQEKINLRIFTERLQKKERQYNELKGKPTTLTKEEKEKERKKNHKANINHKLMDPIVRKKGKDKMIQEEQEKIKKEMDKNVAELEKLTCFINELVIGNQNLKNNIIDLRTRKADAIKQRDMLKEQNQQKRDEIQELKEQNKFAESKIRKSEYDKEVERGRMQQKDFEQKRDDLEREYHKIIEEAIKRERETKKEQAKRRMMQKQVSQSKTMFKGQNAKEVEKQRKAVADDEILDRTPILDIQIEKWTEMNKKQKQIISKSEKTSQEIKGIFDDLTKYLGLDSFEQLPEEYSKIENQMSRINIELKNLNVRVDDLEAEKLILQNKISYLSGKKHENSENKSEFLKKKEEEIENISKAIESLERDIEHKRLLFKKIQPETDKYLNKLNVTYLADYVPNKMNVDENIGYTEQTVNKFISNVEDYYKLIQEFDESVKKHENEELSELDRLRLEIREKLENFEKNKLLNKNLYSSMKTESKNGVEFSDIIRHTSNMLMESIENPYNISFNESKKRGNNDTINQSQLPTQDGHHYNDSTAGNQQQSSIIVPNNNSSEVRNESVTRIEEEKGEENEKGIGKEADEIENNAKMEAELA